MPRLDPRLCSTPSSGVPTWLCTVVCLWSFRAATFPEQRLGTKYFGGHSDLLCGVLVVKTLEEWTEVRIGIALIVRTRSFGERSSAVQQVFRHVAMPDDRIPFVVSRILTTFS